MAVPTSAPTGEARSAGAGTLAFASAGSAGTAASAAQTALGIEKERTVSTHAMVFMSILFHGLRNPAGATRSNAGSTVIYFRVTLGSTTLETNTRENRIGLREGFALSLLAHLCLALVLLCVRPPRTASASPEAAPVVIRVMDESPPPLAGPALPQVVRATNPIPRPTRAPVPPVAPASPAARPNEPPAHKIRDEASGQRALNVADESGAVEISAGASPPANGPAATTAAATQHPHRQRRPEAAEPRDGNRAARHGTACARPSYAAWSIPTSPVAWAGRARSS